MISTRLRRRQRRPSWSIGSLHGADQRHFQHRLRIEQGLPSRARACRQRLATSVRVCSKAYGNDEPRTRERAEVEPENTGIDAVRRAGPNGAITARVVPHEGQTARPAFGARLLGAKGDVK